MKKMILGAVLCGGILVGISNGAIAHAADPTTTTTTAEIQAGAVTFTVEPKVDFGKKPLSATVEFDKAINYTVTDFTGNVAGYTLQAKLQTAMETGGELTLGGKKLSTTEQVVKTETKNNVGANPGTLDAKLTYTGVTQAKKMKAATVVWTYSAGSKKEIQE